MERGTCHHAAVTAELLQSSQDDRGPARWRGYLEVSKEITAACPKWESPKWSAAAPLLSVQAPWNSVWAFTVCRAIGHLQSSTLSEHHPAPTLVLQLPLLQLSLDLVQHHSQLPQDFLQVIHVVVLQDLGLVESSGDTDGWTDGYASPQSCPPPKSLVRLWPTHHELLLLGEVWLCQWWFLLVVQLHQFRAGISQMPWGR